MTNLQKNDNGSKMHVAIIGIGSGDFASAIKAVYTGACIIMIEQADLIGGR